MLHIKTGAECPTPCSRKFFDLVVTCRIVATVDSDGSVGDDWFTSFASLQDHIMCVKERFRDVAVGERLFVSDRNDLKPLLDKMGRELPEFFEFAIRVDND